ncbi:MAG: hypothetical protein KC680_02470 [Candidatus Peregrinibacteria bacterium]|nr:hypothetical protein [Candidatus Peregrinibacteria bacterium]MCB9808058.1 hypothetical protein [Candidatus Peribacteria bacterium]
MKYFELVPFAFKKFCIMRAFRTGIPTVMHYIKRPALKASDRPALFTMNIMPPMMTVWYHFVRKNLGDTVDTVIFDCSGTLKKQDFPGAHVQKFLNFYAATKTDEFLYHIAQNRKLGWMCDDDMFIISDKCIGHIEKEFADPNTASLSFRPRNWWHFDLDGTTYEPSSSYCTVINRTIYCDKEHLNLSPADGNVNAVSHIGKEMHRYDTFDQANEVLISKGYRCAIAPEKERNKLVTGFSGVSSAVMLLWHFSSAEKFMAYLEAPEDKSWRGNTLYTILSGLLAISSMQEMHETITGSPYHLRAMPSKTDLNRLVKEKSPLLREGHDFEKTLSVAEQLRKAL